MLGRPIVGGIGDRRLEDRTHGTGPPRRRQVLDVLAVRADIADVRKRERDDLAGIGRIGQYFLIAGQRGVEAQFRLGFARGAETQSLEHCPVGQDQDGGGARLRPGRGRALRFGNG